LQRRQCVQGILLVLEGDEHLGREVPHLHKHPDLNLQRSE
jgi:hypothetical protein